MFLAMRPEKPPTFTMGKGTFKDENGKRVVDDPLMKISVPTFNIDFYAFFDQHYVRLMTLTADLEIPVSLDIDNMGKIVPVLGELTSAFKNTRVSNSELLAEAPGDLAQTFPMLIGLAGGQLSSALAPIALPAIMGLNIAPKTITSTDPDGNGVNQYLAIYADLVPGPTMAKRWNPVRTTARLAQLSNPATAEFAVGSRQHTAPTVTLEVGGTTVEGLPLEFQYMVDDAGWSPFSVTDRLAITHPLLWLQGHHTIAVRARAVGRPTTLDMEGARVGVIIDTIAPEGRLVAEHGTLRIADAFDRVTARESLVWRHRVGQGEPSAWHTIDQVVPLAGVAQHLVTAEISDEAGNLGHLDFHGRTTAPADSGCGCTLGAAAPSPTGPAMLLAAIAIAITVLGRRALLLLVLLAGCSRGLGPGDFLNELDEVGRWNAVAAHKGVFHVSAYDTSMGDLAYARIAEIGAPIKWQYVDGVDPTSGMGMPEMPRMGFTDPGPDVGTHTSIAVNKDGKARIAYYDTTNNALKFALGDVLFETHAIDVGQTGVTVGLYTALTLDEADRPTIAYMATGISNGKQGFKSELRVATAATPMPKSSGDWTVSVVDSAAISCAGRCATGSACIMATMVNGMPNGDPAVSTCVPVDKAACPSMCGDTEVCIAAKCTEILVPQKAIDLPDGTGLFTQALRTAGGLLLVYYDRAQGDLKLASQQSGGGFKVTIIDGGDPSTDVGQFPAAAVADGGTLHVAYVDAIADRLLYKTVTAGMPAMTPEVIDDGMRTDGPRPIGSGAAMILEGGSPRVVYQDQQRADLMDARRAGAWTRSAIKSGAPGYGWWPHLVSDGGRTYLAQFVYDRAIQPPKPIGRFELGAMP
jgi:hypothetical protein